MYLDFKKKFSGFTVVEALVSVAIVSVILSVIILNQSKYSDRVALTYLADDIASSVAEAQSYGIAVKEFGTGSQYFQGAYGIIASILSPLTTTSYLFFVDTNGDGIYGNIFGDSWTCPVGGGSECLRRVDFANGNYIDSICAVHSSGNINCNIGRADITFARPNVNARLKLFLVNSGNEYQSNSVRGVRIVLRSPSGDSRSVTVYTNGQISVQ